MMKLINNRKRMFILAGIVLILLLLCGGLLFFRHGNNTLKEEGMGDLLLDENDTPREETFSDQSGQTEASGTIRGDDKQDPSPHSDPAKSDTVGISSDQSVNNDTKAPPASDSDSSASEEDSSSSGNSEPSDDNSGSTESTNRHPYELPLVPVQNS